MKNFFFLVVGLAVITGSFYLVMQKPAPSRYQAIQTIQIGEKTIIVEIADTEVEREMGLSGRETLADGAGMLFIFGTPGKYGFWMKDMNFPIDIVWVDESFIVRGVERLVNPYTYPRVFYPPDNIKYVLEIGAGEASNLGIDIGTKVSPSL
ncbi:MAG: DUF192 domain-containing protein [Patescibacteria group bacterium]